MPKKPVVNLTRLQKLMDAKEWGIGELAAYSDVKYDTVYSLVKGRRRNNSAETLTKIAAALGVSVDYLLEKNGEGEPPAQQLPAAVRKLSDIAGRLPEVWQDELVQIAAALERLKQEQAEHPMNAQTMAALLDLVQKLRDQGGKDEDILPRLETLLRSQLADWRTLGKGEDVTDEPAQDE